MTRKAPKSLAGKWRIVEMELWGANFLDMIEPACIAFDGRGSGEFLFGCVAASLDCADTPSGGDSTWQGRDEMEEASGDGFADLEDDGSLTDEIRFHNSGESTYKRRPW